MVGSFFLGGSPVLADDEMPSGGPAAETKTIQWIDGFAAATAAAKKSGKIMFVYFGRHHPT